MSVAVAARHPPRGGRDPGRRNRYPHFYRGVSEERICALLDTHGARVAQVFCHAPLAELGRRHAARVDAGLRPGIDFPFDHAALPPSANWEPLTLDGPLLRVDTTSPDAFALALTWAQECRAQPRGT